MSLSEFEIIRRYFAESGLYFDKPGVEIGIGDDAAVLKIPSNKLLVISMDVLVESVHFPKSADASLVANRALAVNLSDLAAMAADPFCFTLGLVLPDADEHWLQGFSEGLLGLAQEFNCPLVGGDTTRGPLSITIQVQGLCEQDGIVRRDSAKPGDKIFVSGYLGDGAIAIKSLGLNSHLGDGFNLEQAKLTESCREYFENAYYKPEPRIALARRCASLVSSGIDVSDGLFGDLGHIVAASGVGALLQTQQFPYSACANSCMSEQNRLQAALFGGDDYELCFSVPPQQCAAFVREAARTDTMVTCIGEIIEGSSIKCLDASGLPMSFDVDSYAHFYGED